MVTRRIKVLLVEDNPGDARLIREMLSGARGMSFDLKCEPSLAEGIRSLGEDAFDAVLLDLTLPDSRGIDTFRSFYSADGKLPVIVLTGLDDEETALAAMQGGAQDYLVKGRVDGELLARSIRYSIERRQVENELRVKDQAIASSVNAIALAGLDNRLTYVNRSALELWGYREEGEMLGRDIREFWVDQGSLRQMQEGLETRGTWSGELAGRKKDGPLFDALVNASMVLDRGGEPISLMAVIVDITERKIAAEQLEELNRCLLSLGPDPRANLEKILEAGRGILGAGALKYFSRVREKEYVCTGSQFSAGHLDCSFPCCALTAGAGEGMPLVMQVPGGPPCELRHPDLEELGLFPTLACQVNALDEVVGALCFFTVKDGQVSPEAQGLLVMLARALAIEEERYRHEEDMRDFIDVASHELRHPITIMKGYAAMLRDQHSDIDESNREVILDIIEHGADRLNNLVGGLLDISRIERGRFEVSLVEQPLAPLIERALEEIRMRGFSNEFRLEFRGEPGVRRMDGEKIVQLMVNLLENAVKYSPSGDPIEVEVEIEAGEQGAVLVTVEDRGIGISQPDRERVFDRFFQVEDVLHHSTPGMGMGLYIAREIVGAHGGRIWCEAREGDGSAFRFTLPRETEQETVENG